jgi:Tol biopolymer transport system component
MMDSEGYLVGSKIMQGFLDGQGSRILMETEGGLEYAVSEDGKLLAYSTCPMDTEGFFEFLDCKTSILDLETGDEFFLPEKEGMAFAPTFSPDGRHLVYWFSPDGERSWFRIYSLETDELKDIHPPENITQAGHSAWGPNP